MSAGSNRLGKIACEVDVDVDVDAAVDVAAGVDVDAGSFVGVAAEDGLDAWCRAMAGCARAPKAAPPNSRERLEMFVITYSPWSVG